MTSDSQGSSRSNVGVTITKIGANSIRVASPYARIGTIDIELERIDNQTMNATGDTPFLVDLGEQPPTLSLSPRNELAYRGVIRSAGR